MSIIILMILPVIAALFLFVAKSSFLNRVVPFIYSIFYLGTSIYFAVTKPFFWIYLGVDSLNSVFMIVLAVLYFGVSLYTIDYFKKNKYSIIMETRFSVLLMMFIFAMTGFLLSRHLGMLWVFIEATTLATAYLIYFNKTKEALDAAWKYIFICTIGISFAFVGIIFLSKGVGGDVNGLFFTNMYTKAVEIDKFWLKLSFVFIMLGFGTKMGLAPMHSWLPDAHSEAPSPISAMLSGTLLNMAFLGILRVYKLMYLAGLMEYANTLLFILGLLSLLFSAAFIIKITNYKKMLAYSSVENMGLIAIALSLGGKAYYAVIIHLIGHSLTKASLFLTAGNILHRYETKEAYKVKGILKRDPVNGWIWILSFLSISAFPPFPIFISEFIIIRELIAKSYYLQLVIILTVLTVIMYGLGIAVFKMAFSDDRVEEHIKSENDEKSRILSFLPQIIFIILLVIIGVSIPEPIIGYIDAAVRNIVGE